MATPPTASMSSASAPLARDPSLAGALPVGISVCPLEAAHQPELLWRSARRCSSCLAYINQFCEVSDGAWKCALCGARNLCPTLTGVSAARDPELTYTVVEYAEPFAQPRQAELPPESGPLALFVVDEHASAQAMRDVRAASAAALAQLPPSARVGLISFGWSVSVYLLDSTAAEAYAFPGVDAPSEDESQQLAGLEPRALQPRGTCESALHRALEALETPDSASPSAADAPRALGAALENLPTRTLAPTLAPSPKPNPNPSRGP